MKQNIRKAILATLGTVAFGAVSTEASAFTAYDFGVLSGKSKTTYKGTAPYKSYTDYSIKNNGWMHTARFEIFTLGTPEEIAAGTRYNVVITMKARVTGQEGSAGPMDNPAFSVWTLGANQYKEVTNTLHSWSQLRGPNDNVANPLSAKPGKLPDGNIVIANNVDNGDSAGLGDNAGTTPNGTPDGGWIAMGVINGHKGWIGYAQSGPSVSVIYDYDALNSDPQTTNGTPVTDEMPYGWFVNRQSPYVYGKKSKGKVTSGQPLDVAQLTLRGLKAGNYLIGSGGSCGTVEPQATCTTGSAFSMTISVNRIGN